MTSSPSRRAIFPPLVPGGIEARNVCVRSNLVLLDEVRLDQRVSLLQCLQAHVVGIALPLGDGVMFHVLICLRFTFALFDEVLVDQNSSLLQPLQRSRHNAATWRW